MIQKILRAVTVLVMALGLAVPATVGATNVFSGPCQTAAAKSSSVCANGQTTTNPLTGTNGLLLKVTRLIAIVAGVTAVIIIILSGFRFVLSSGDSAKATAARNNMLYAIAGLVIILVAQYLISLVISRL